MKHFFIAALSLVPMALSHAADRSRPNVLIMVADDLGYGDVSCLSHGAVKTPNLDRLAKSGIKFTAGYVTAPLCAPSRAGFFTGLYQQRFGFLDNEGAIPTNLPLLPGVLRNAGYHTGLMGKWHSEGPAPHERGCFDETLCSARPSPFLDYFDPKLSRNGKMETHQGYISDVLAGEAEDFIERNKTKPFSLTVTFNAPHIAKVVKPFHLIRKEYDAALAEGKIYDVPKSPTARHGEVQKYSAQFPGDSARADTVATITALDEAVGRILDKLHQTGLAKNTIVFFFGDNGAHPENRSDNGALRDYKWSHFEGGIRVPFLAAYPGVFPAGLEYAKPVSTLDIFPTVASLTGTTPPSNLDGVNLTPFLNGEKSESPHETLFFNTTKHGAIRQGQWKLVMVPSGPSALFDLEKDAEEKHDLASAEPTRVKLLEESWQTWRAQMPPPAMKSK
ncbi:MAG: sulfatase-like hydrolase/transferase [Verrucomicrobiota bacterium]